MVLAMTRPTKRADSSHHQFRKRVPHNIPRGDALILTIPGIDEPIGVTIGNEIKFSLRTRDPAEAKARTAAANAQIELRFKNLREGPNKLTHKQLVALSGEAYRLLVARYQDDPGSCDIWACVKANNRAAREGRVNDVPLLDPDNLERERSAVGRFGPDLTSGLNALPLGPEVLEARYGKLADWVLYANQLHISRQCRTNFIVQIDQAVTDAAWRLKRNAAGDYTPDPKADRFPPIEAAKPSLTLDELFDRWKAERQPAASTIATWSSEFRALKAHIGHNDAKRVTRADVIRFKDALIANGRSAKAVLDGPISALKAVFRFAVDNGLLAGNPAEDIRIVVKKRAGEKMLGYTDDEVARLLSMCPRETNAARRWLPLLAACTGARIGELAQLHGKNISDSTMFITPAEDGGTLKNPGSEREVPIHPALVKAGFIEFVRARGDGSLFYTHTSGRPEARHASKGVTNHLATWIREQGFTDPRKAPSHALRHWFKTKCAELGIPDSIADAIQGHSPKGVAGRYRSISMALKADAISKIPIPGQS
ncbi:tyrosine-type recombinase/integrase [Prosthecomicrobium sp. N25]|uniref:tyrosine-type recombinase/integrase n=1 Tax=Prosthecomicrobium sp. N25 TaxID=3129254 RepID=UPI003077EA75